MDFVNWGRRISQGISKYKYVWIVLLAGIILMMLPTNGVKTEQTSKNDYSDLTLEKDLATKLEEILVNLSGAGRVQVMLSVAQGERIIYQTDSTCSQSSNGADTKSQTVLVTDSQRNETGLLHQKNPPVYQGAIILAQGAENPAVKLKIVEAVSNVTGLGADRISVFQMK